MALEQVVEYALEYEEWAAVVGLEGDIGPGLPAFTKTYLDLPKPVV